MDSEYEFADSILSLLKCSIELAVVASLCWQQPVQPNLQYFLALLEHLPASANFMASWARCHEQAKAFRALWTNSTEIVRLKMTISLAYWLTQLNVIDLISQVLILSYLLRGSLQLSFRDLWRSCSLEGRAAMIIVLVWLTFCAFLFFYRWLSKRR